MVSKAFLLGLLPALVVASTLKDRAANAGQSPLAASISSTPAASATETPEPTSVEEIEELAATASTSSKTSEVKGKIFDRFVQIWLENTDYDKAEGDPNMKKLAKEGITLSNYYALTHLSEPNYVGAVGGSYFGIYSDEKHWIPENISCVVDLLDTKGISWAEYQENMPYSGMENGGYRDPNDGYWYYVRKHNPLIMYDIVAKNETRRSMIKNETLFASDLKADKLPQWMFYTPNMKNDGHDTSITYAANWTWNFLEPLLKDKNFMKNTLVLLTFDESQAYHIPNHVYSLLLGDAIPEDLKGTIDPTFYTHYSTLSTVEANWGLPHLGLGDVEKPGNNVFQFVADKTGWENVDVKGKYPKNNKSKPGPFNTMTPGPWPTPDVKAVGAGNMGILEKIAKQYGTTPATPSATTASDTATGTANGTIEASSSATQTNSANRAAAAAGAVAGAVAVAAGIVAL